MNYKFLSASTLLVVLMSTVTAQTVRINEVTSSNSIYTDEDGDTPDWIELHNYGTQSVSINNWGLSDDVLNLTKWVFPNITLSPDQYLLLWASSKNRSEVTFATTLVNQGDSFKYLTPNSEPDPNWKNASFDDSGWSQGNSGFGYADGDDATEVPNGTQSVYLRVSFNVSDLSTLTSLILDMDYDDAFVAYINGTEVARANINGVPPPYNSPTIQDHEALMYSGGTPERFLISNPEGLLNAGENILTIQGHNISAGSSDFTIIPFLSAVFSTPNSSGVNPPEILGLTSGNLHTNFKIASNSETLTLSDATSAVVDQVVIENLPPNTSYGVSVTNGSLVSYTEMTPGSVNSSNDFLGAIGSSVIFSKEGGYLSGQTNLTLSGNLSGQSIRYTTDATIPTKTSPIYGWPIQISENTVVRARIFQDNYLPSPCFSKTYVFEPSKQLDTVFLTTDPENLFNEDTGIYVYGPPGSYDYNIPYFGANFWEDWERPVHISFHESDTNTIAAEFDAGIKIYGAWSRGQNGQRSLSLFARGQYGDSKFDHPFFDELNYDDFQSVILRNSGQDWMRSSMKDIMVTSLMRGSGIDFQEHNSVATFINGDYWGMYNMREKNNEHMLAAKHNIDADDITILTKNAEIIEGDNTDYNELIGYISSVDLSVDANFEYVSDRIDLTNYALYQATNVFISNSDWPGNNIKFWNHPEGKWRWILYDTDFGFASFFDQQNYTHDTLSFALDANGPGWPNPAWSTLLFRKLVTNIGFRNQFINRYADELNTRFLSSALNTHIDQVYQSIQPEVIDHYLRWRSDPTLTGIGVNIGDRFSEINQWVGYYVDLMKTFANERPAIAKEHLKSNFNLPEYHPLTIINNNTTEGFVEVNQNLKIQESAWTGDYFESVPIQLTAIPEAGYEFSHWSGASNATTATISMNLTTPLGITPNFSAVENEKLLVINEINYNSGPDFNADDWIELHNPNAYAVDISFWIVKDSDNSHIYTIPNGTSIDAGGFIVIVKDAIDFTAVFPEITNYIGDLGFGLGSGGDSVRLFDADNILQDQVIYTSETPWPVCPNDTGYTLELTDPELDNSLPQSWNCNNLYGSPDAHNTVPLSISDIVFTTPVIYPNPTQSVLNILGNSTQFEVIVFTVTGQKMLDAKMVNQINVEALPSGIYFIQISENTTTNTLKFIKR